jgi:ppGpp synthetase/RelA/SpoT-type nucleotidyltranferase
VGVPAGIEIAHNKLGAAIGSVAVTVQETVSAYASKHDYICFGRSKQTASLTEKLESGRFLTWSAVDDLYACTVVVPTASHEPAVVDFLQDVFDIVEVRSRDTREKPPDVFRFDTTRVICRLHPQAGLDRPPGAESLLFEVQIPSVFQYAWGVVTRDLAYKAETVDWSRLRLVAQLKASVEQIETVIGAFESAASGVISSGHPETDTQARCLATFKAWFDGGLLSASLRPQSWSKFGENVYALVRSYAGRSGAVDATQSLLEEIDRVLRAVDPGKQVVSGSLFQLVVGVVARGGGAPARHIRKFAVVDSAELRDVHGVTTVPKPIVFDVNVGST